MLNIKIDPSAEEVGFVSMLTDLMQQNVQQHPKRAAEFNALKGSVAIEARDAEVSLTLDFLGGEAVAYGGIKGKPDVLISTDSAAVLELSNAKLRFGLPDLADESGRAVVKKMLSGELKISGSGLFLKPMLLIRFTKLLSVSLDAEFGLLAGEEVRCRTKLHWAIFCWPALATLAALGLAFAGPDWRGGAVVFSVLAAALWIADAVRFGAAEFTVTDKRILAKSGIFKKRKVITAPAEAATIEVKPCLLGGVFGFGKLTLQRNAGEKESFCSVARAAEFRDAWQTRPRPEPPAT